MPRRRLCDDHPSPVDRLSHRRRRSLNLSRDAHPHHAKIWNENRHRFPRHVKACCRCKTRIKLTQMASFSRENGETNQYIFESILIVTSAHDLLLHTTVFFLFIGPVLFRNDHQDIVQVQDTADTVDTEEVTSWFLAKSLHSQCSSKKCKIPAIRKNRTSNFTQGKPSKDAF